MLVACVQVPLFTIVVVTLAGLTLWLPLLVTAASLSDAKSIRNAKNLKNCDDVREAGHTSSGLYTIYLNESWPLEVLCDHGINKSYIIIQQRMYGNENFYRGWADYQIGFGKTSGDFWLGLQAINALTGQGNTVLDIQMQDWMGNNRGGTYKYFAIGNVNDRYRLQVASYTGNVPDDLSFSNGMQFATWDSPDFYQCAVHQKAGWWYNYCSYALPNGYYYPSGPYVPSGGFYDGIYWKDWLGYGYSLRFFRMMLSHP